MTLIAVAAYPVIIDPKLNPQKYRKLSDACLDETSTSYSPISPARGESGVCIGDETNMSYFVGDQQRWIRDKVPLEETQPGGWPMHCCRL